jgi:hypothetical protein
VPRRGAHRPAQELIYQSKTLLVGEGGNEDLLASIRSVVEGDEAVDRIIGSFGKRGGAWFKGG